MSDACEFLTSVFYAAVESVRGDRLVERYFRQNSVVDRCCVVAIGKAAQAMAFGACQTLGDRVVSGLVITSPDYIDANWTLSPQFKIIFGNHPVPGLDSLVAGESLLEFIEQYSSVSRWVFLISGGSSSLVEALASGVSFEDLREATQWMLANGWTIDAINGARKRLSRIKGGGLLSRFRDQRITALYISDVPGDRVETIGSGMLVNRREEDANIEFQLPPAVVKRSTPVSSTPRFVGTVTHEVIGSLSSCLDGAKRFAEAKIHSVVVDPRRLEGEAFSTGVELHRFLCKAAPGLYLWGGETVVTLPEKPGFGGRAQTVAAGFVHQLKEPNIGLLVAGSDGRDGVSRYAGVCADIMTRQQMESLQMELEPFLKAANLADFFHRVGGGIPAFASGTNVADLFFALKS